MALFLLSVMTMFVVSTHATNFQPWNTLPQWPYGSPWSSWITADFELGAPWNMPNYRANHCFDAAVDNGLILENYIEFDPQADCQLCKGYTESTPGYAPDPNDCQKFYMCTNVNGEWQAFVMTCPDCTFWNQNVLTCTRVQADSDRCPVSPAATGYPTIPTPEPKRLVTCVTFDEGYDGVQGRKGLWVLNKGVRVENDSSICSIADSCGHFNGLARLEFPFFSNNLQWYSAFSLSLFFKRTAGANNQGVISNDCFENAMHESANSIFVSSQENAVSAGLVDADGIEASVSGVEASDNDWHHIVLSWDGTEVKAYLDGSEISDSSLPTAFNGPIREADKCPLVVGSFIRPASYFNGYMDEVCVLNSALSASEVTAVYNDPSYIYDL